MKTPNTVAAEAAAANGDTATPATKTRKPRVSKAQKAEQATREAAIKRDQEEARAAADRIGVNQELKIIKTLDLDPAALDFRPDLQSRYADVGEEQVLELADSIRTQGQLSPIQVRENSAGRYDVIYGNTRAKAAQHIVQGYTDKSGKYQIKGNPNFRLRAEVVDCTDEDAIKRNISENVQRFDCTPIDRMHAHEKLRSLDMNDAEIARLCGFKSQASVHRYAKLFKLVDPIKDKVHKGELTFAGAFLLVDLPPQDQEFVLEKCEELARTKTAQQTTVDRAKVDVVAVDEENDPLRFGQTDVQKALKLLAEKKSAERKAEKEAKAAEPKEEGGSQEPTEEESTQDEPATTDKKKRVALTIKQVKDDFVQLKKSDRCPPKVADLMTRLLEYMANDLELKDLNVYLQSILPE